MASKPSLFLSGFPISLFNQESDVLKRSQLGMMTMINGILGALVLVSVLAAGVVRAQDATAEVPVPQAAENESPAYPAGLDDPSIDLEELELRLVPLTLDQLRALAAAWQDQARTSMQALIDKVLEIRSAEDTDAEALREERLALVEERNLVFEKFSAVVSDLEAKGADPAEVKALRDYITAIRKEERSQLTLQEFADSLMRWLTSADGGAKLGIRIAIIVGAWFVLLIVARVVRAWMRRVVERMPNLSNLLSNFLVMVVYWLTLAFGLMFVLAAVGINITPLFALVGGASFIIAFAMQETLSNLASGLMIMINRPFDEGDYVLVAGLGGTVKHVSVVSTTVTTPDNQVIVIPNAKVWGDIITNVTASEIRRVDLVFGIGYDDSIEQAQQVLENVVENHPLVMKDPAPMIRVSELADSSVNFIVRPWTKTSDYWSVYWDLQRAVKEAFDANGISIPFPQTDMHVHVADTGKTSSDKAAVPVLTGRDTKPRREATDYAGGDDGTDNHEEEGGGDRG
jgi:small conductance mechanosensitive channel